MTQMTLKHEHHALTRTLRHIALLWLISFLGVLPFASSFLAILIAPCQNALGTEVPWITVHPLTPIFWMIKLALIASGLVSLPLGCVLFFRYLRPALFPHERRWLAWQLGAACSMLFLGGYLSYQILAPWALQSLLFWMPQSLAYYAEFEVVLNLIFSLWFACTLALALPWGLHNLLSIGWISLKKAREARPYVVVSLYTLGMLLTPPDVVCQILLATPLWGLYELILLYHQNRTQE